jgi:hypothetical protein
MVRRSRRFLSRTGEGPKRELGGADFDGFSDLGMRKRGNLDPQFSGPGAHPEGAPRTTKHRFQNLSVPATERGCRFRKVAAAVTATQIT